jgi:hypothetical protein
MPPGGKFDVHADRNMAYETGLTRHLSLITYLNKSWKHEYGGQFELWNHDGSRREAVVEPLFNRTVIFEIADQNFHGVPSPIASPGGRCRTSFVVYYHTAQGQSAAPHSSVFPNSRKSTIPGGASRPSFASRELYVRPLSRTLRRRFCGGSNVGNLHIVPPSRVAIVVRLPRDLAFMTTTGALP